MSIKNLVAAVLLVGVSVGMSGCGKTAENPPVAANKTDGEESAHSDWWCSEHGLPEEKCGLCSKKLLAECKAKGDWCEKHDRPDSQCFACHPELQAQFAADYVAKYGKQPPKPTDNGA